MQGNYTDSDFNDLSNEVTNPGMSGVGRSASDEERCNALYNLEVTDFIVIDMCGLLKHEAYSTVTLLARLRG